MEDDCMSIGKKIAYMFILLMLIIAVAFGSVTFLAYRGMPEAEVLIGEMYKEGFLIYPQNHNQAKKWFSKAAKKNNSDGQCSLGGIYEIEKKYHEAAHWYAKAAIQDLPRCQYNFGRLFSQGLGIEKNEKAAFIWTKKAADNKNSYAQYSVGVELIQGKVVARDITKAIDYLKLSAEQGNAKAQGYLALIYLKGEILPMDLIQAKKMAILAVKNRDSQAELLLSEISKLDHTEN